MAEFRLYYDDTGAIICYTGEDLPGKYIVIDAMTFAECRHDIKVIDGKIVKLNDLVTISKLAPSTTGIRCASEDACIIVDNSYIGKTITWDIKTYELKPN